MFNVNQITSELAKMADPMLQKYAALHKNDPYTVALAVGESNRRKAMRTAAQGRAAGQQQPKVVDQDIAEMAAVDPMGNMTGALPENIGIGRLPAPNMAPIGKAEGGIIGYADRGAVRTPPEVAIKDLIDRYSQEYKVDPALLTQIVGVESGKKAAEAKNPKSSAHGLGQLVDTMWGKMGGGERTDPEVQVRNAAKLLRSNTDSFTKANGRPPDPSEAYTTWFLGDPTGRAVLRADPNASVEDVIRKADPKGADRIMKANASVLQDKKVGDVMRWTQGKMAPVMGANTPVPFGSTQAEPAAPAAPAIPQTQPVDPRATSPGPVALAGVPAVGAASVAPRLLDKFAPSIVNDSAALKNALKTTARSGNVLAATTGLGALATETAGQNLKQLPQEQRRELANNALLSALSDHTGEAAAIMDAKANNPEGPSKMPYLDQMGKVGSLLGDVALGRNGRGVGALLGNGPKEPEVKPPPATTDRLSPQVPDELKRIEAAQRGAAEDVQVKPPEAPPAAPTEGKTTGGGGLASLFKDPAFFMAMRLLANKNPDLGGAVGEAGIGTVGDLAAAEKASSEAEYRKSMGKYYGSYADAIERGAKEKNEVQLAEKSAQEALDTWAKNNKMALLQSPGLYDQMRNKYRMDAYNVYGIKMPTAVAQQGAPQNDPLGILGKG